MQRQAQEREQREDAQMVAGRKSLRPHRKQTGGAQTDRNRVSVSDAKVARALDRMADGVAEIEHFARPGLETVVIDIHRLDPNGLGDDRFPGPFSKRVGRERFQRIESIVALDDSVFDEFRQTLAQEPVRQGRQRIDIGDDGNWVFERSGEILARRRFFTKTIWL